MHVQAIKDSLKIFQQAKEIGIELKCLDIGGGFPVNYSEIDKEIDLFSFCEPLREILKTVPAGIDVIAEPGRYLVSPCQTLVFSVIGVA